MIVKILAIFLLVWSVTVGCQSPDRKNNASADHTTAKDAETSRFTPHVEILADEGAQIIDAQAEVVILSGGFNWTEGPVYIKLGDYLLFSDIPENKIYKWKDGEGISEFLTPSGFTGILDRDRQPGSNGLLLNADGQLVLCQHGDRRLALLESPLDEAKPVYATIKDNYKGKRLNSPNDAVFHSNGDLYFTDPPYGLDKGIDDPARELDFQGVYRLRPDGQIDLITKALKYPNGIALSPDEKTLYVACSDPDNAVWMSYELNEKGLAAGESVFYDASAYGQMNKGLPDGMKTNKAGYIFATGPEGLWIFNPEGKVLAKVFTGQKTSNCALSADEKLVFLTADDFVMRVKLI